MRNMGKMESDAKPDMVGVICPSLYVLQRSTSTFATSLVSQTPWPSIRMDDLSVDDIALQLSDLEIALLLCLVAREHCLIETTEDSIHDVAKELALVCK